MKNKVTFKSGDYVTDVIYNNAVTPLDAARIASLHVIREYRNARVETDSGDVFYFSRKEIDA